MKQSWVDPNPGYGEKSGFRRISVTLPPEIYESLVRESARRKIAGQRNQLLSSILREAVTLYMERLPGLEDRLETAPAANRTSE